MHAHPALRADLRIDRGAPAVGPGESPSDVSKPGFLRYLSRAVWVRAAAPGCECLPPLCEARIANVLAALCRRVAPDHPRFRVLFRNDSRCYMQGPTKICLTQPESLLQASFPTRNPPRQRPLHLTPQETPTMDGTRSRRTKDPIRQQWYALCRQQRFARFLGFPSDPQAGSQAFEGRRRFVQSGGPEGQTLGSTAPCFRTAG